MKREKRNPTLILTEDRSHARYATTRMAGMAHFRLQWGGKASHIAATKANGLPDVRKYVG